MKLQILTSATAALAVLSTSSAEVSNEDAVSVEAEKRSLWSHDLVSPGISFVDQAEDAIEAFVNGDEGGSKKEKKSSISKDSENESRDGGFEVGMCDPDDTQPEHRAICEDIWFAFCSPEVEDEIDDEFCDWLGFTADVDWVDDEDLDAELVYERFDYGSSKKVKKTLKKALKKAKSNKNFVVGMCDPDVTKPEVEEICDDLWITLCSPEVEDEVDDEFCDWLGFTADVEWYGEEDFDFDTFDSEDGPRRNIRGRR